MDTTFKIGDSIVVKEGVTDADFSELVLGGQQGRIVEFDTDEEGEQLVDIAWDGQSLQAMKDLIPVCDEEGIEWRNCTLYLSEILPATARDTAEEADIVAIQLFNEYIWSDFGEQGKRICAVVGHLDHEQHEDIDFMQAWTDHMASKLLFPFEARISELPENENLEAGELVKVKSLASPNDLMGVMVSVNAATGHYEIPLCDLETDNAKYIQLLDDYNTWYAEA